jgi:hypothetical protein
LATAKWGGTFVVEGYGVIFTRKNIRKHAKATDL